MAKNITVEELRAILKHLNFKLEGDTLISPIVDQRYKDNTTLNFICGRDIKIDDLVDKINSINSEFKVSCLYIDLSNKCLVINYIGEIEPININNNIIDNINDKLKGKKVIIDNLDKSTYIKICDIKYAVNNISSKIQTIDNKSYLQLYRKENKIFESDSIIAINIEQDQISINYFNSEKEPNKLLIQIIGDTL